MKTSKALTGLAAARLLAQQITDPTAASARELVKYMGIMQAQDYQMAEWAAGLRIPGAVAADIRAALDRGELIRTHVLRPTWHLVSPDDIYWMTELCAKRILSASRSRFRDLGLDKGVTKKSNRLIEAALSEGRHLTRQELVALLEAAGIPNEDNRAAHIFIRAELEGIICSGVSREGKQTYALLAERVPQKRLLAREEALAVLALRYFTSHGPATLKDFAWWSGLSLTDARTATNDAASQLDTIEIEGLAYWFKAGSAGAALTATRNISTAKTGAAAAQLLPAFDEYIIGYTDRSAIIEDDRFKNVIAVNGLFRPVVLVKGRVAGVWKRTLQKDSVNLEVSLFSKQPASVHAAIKKQAGRFCEFLGKTSVSTNIK